MNSEPPRTHHFLGATADGRMVYVSLPEGIDVPAALEAARAQAAAQPDGPDKIVTLGAQPVDLAPGRDWATPTRIPLDVDMIPLTADLVNRKARRQQFGVSRPSGASWEIAEPIRGPSTPAPRNAPCPCGSGRKTKRCHGRQ